MSYGPWNGKNIAPAVRSTASRVKRFFPGNKSVGVPAVGARQSARTAPNGKPAKGVGTLKGGGVR
jgi:hypothetical protein